MKQIYFLILCAFTPLLALSQEQIEGYFPSKKDQVSEQSITVEPYLQLSNGAFFTALTLVSDNPYVEFVEGFKFEWGYRYQLRVKETIYAYPPEDVSDRSYELVEVVLQSPALEPFSMIVVNEFYLSEPKGEAVSKIQAGLYRYHNAMEFKVPPMLRAEFDRKMKKKSFCKGYFDFDKDGSIILLRVE